MSNVVRFRRDKVYEFSCEDGHRFYLPFHFPMDILEMVNFFEGTTCPFCQVDFKKLRLNSKPLEVVE